MKCVSLIIASVLMTSPSWAVEAPQKPGSVDKPGVVAPVKNKTGVQVKPENRAKLCSPNVTQSCKTNTVTQGTSVCKQDECTCVNPDGKSTYQALDTGLYDCVPKSGGVKDPAKVQTN